MIKIDSKMTVGAGEALAAHAAQLFAGLGSTRLVLAELRSVERTEPSQDEDKEQAVKVRVISLEVASPEQEEVLRKALLSLYTLRTAYGTLTGDTDIELAQRTLDATEGDLVMTRAAELEVGISRYADRLQDALHQPKLNASSFRREVEKVIDGLKALNRGTYLS